MNITDLVPSASRRLDSSGRWRWGIIVGLVVLGAAAGLGCRAEESSVGDITPATSVTAPNTAVPSQSTRESPAGDQGSNAGELQGYLFEEASFISYRLRLVSGWRPDPGSCGSKPCLVVDNQPLNWQAVGGRCAKLDTYSGLAKGGDVWARLYQETAAACTRAAPYIPRVTEATTDEQNKAWATEALGDLPAAVEAAKAALE
jgi:hypothetical protein